MYRVFEKYPDALHQGINRLQEKLEDSDPGQPNLHLTKTPAQPRHTLRCGLRNCERPM